MKLIELLESTNPKQSILLMSCCNEIIGCPDDLMAFVDKALLQENIFDVSAQLGGTLVVNITVPTAVEW